MSDAVMYIENVVKAMRTDPAVIALLPEKLQGLAPFYIPGHRLYTANQLVVKNIDKVFKDQKYPLVSLLMDYPGTPKDGLITYTLTIGIFCLTEANYTTEQRYAINFRPLLQPLYRAFIRALLKVGKFVWPGDREYPPHAGAWEHPFWGTVYKEGTEKYIFNDRLDCIEIVDLKVSKVINKCL